MASTISTAQLNNSAIALLHSGRTQEAMEALQVALSTLRDQFKGVAEPRGMGSCSTGKGAISVLGSASMRKQHGASFLEFYDRGLLVDTTARCEDETLLSAVILFNMALLHHARGLEVGKSEFLERASCLYHIAVGIIQQQDVNATTDLILLALLNNMAHVDSYLCRLDDMKDSLEQMREILSTEFIDCDADPINEDDYIIFSLNVMFGTTKELSVAPAA